MGKSYWLQWIKYTGIRTLKTIAEVMIGFLSGNAFGVTDVDWIGALSVSAVAGVVCILSCIVSLPELDKPVPKKD